MDCEMDRKFRPSPFPKEAKRKSVAFLSQETIPPEAAP
jgi:hypothetical protein